MNEAEPRPGEAAATPPPTFISGKWVILTVLGLGLFGSVFAWLWLYDAQRRPRDFWGYGAWQLIGLAPHADALLLRPEPAAPAGKPHPVWYEGLVVVPQEPNTVVRYIIAERKDVAKAPGLSLAGQSSSLREALAHHRSFLWESKAAQLQQPVWRYALVFANDPPPAAVLPGATAAPSPSAAPSPTATVSGTPLPAPVASPPSTRMTTILFDDECRFVRLQSVDKPVVLDPGIAEQFRKFFLTTFPPAP